MLWNALLWGLAAVLANMIAKSSTDDASPIIRALQRFAASGLAGGFVEFMTLPIDIGQWSCVAVSLISAFRAHVGSDPGKVRLQLQKPLPDGTMAYKNMFQATYRVGVDEGLPACWKGGIPALTRQISYTGLSLVCYEPIRDFISGGTPLEELGFWWRLLAGGTAGGLSIAIVNPTDVVKTQLQNAGVGTKLTMSTVINRVWEKQGLLGFWSGVQPNVARCFIGNACELGLYDQAKLFLVTRNIHGPLAHFGASSFAGFASAVASCPLDVVRTRLFQQVHG